MDTTGYKPAIQTLNSRLKYKNRNHTYLSTRFFFGNPTPASFVCEWAQTTQFRKLLQKMKHPTTNLPDAY